jgi:hypothetical protein
MMRKRASIKGIGASIFCSPNNDPEPDVVRTESSSWSSAAATSSISPLAEQPTDEQSTAKPSSQAPEPSAQTRAEPEPAPIRVRAERQPLLRPRLHLVPPVQAAAISDLGAAPAQPAPAEPVTSPVRIELTPIPVAAQPEPTSAPVEPPPATPASVPAAVVLERAPDGEPDPPDTPPEPVMPPLSTDAPSTDLTASTPAQESTARERLGDGLPKAMLDEIGVLYERVTNTTGAHVEMAERAMDLLSAARDLLLLGGAADFNLAERKVNEAKLILNRIDQSRRWSNTYGWGLLLYELVLFTGLVAAIIFDRGLAEWFGGLTGSGTATPTMSAIFAPWSTMLWGGIGGIVGALYSLHWHVAELQDFDRQYSFWYIVQPFMGLILGGIIHLVIVAGMLALVPVSGLADGAKVAAAAVNWFPCLVACLAGFRQKFAYELMDNIMKAVGRQPAAALKSNS